MGYDPDFEGAISEILSKKYGVSEDIFDILSLDYNEDTGYDDAHYGWYTEIPSWDSLDSETQKLITEILISDIPFGETEYISDADLSETKADPLNARIEYDEWLYYSNIEYTNDFLTQLDSISEKIRENLSANDELAVKALIFSAFSLTESHVRNQVWKSIPDINRNVLNIQFQNILTELFSEKLQRYNEMQKIYKRFTGLELDDIPNRKPFRDTLAHDIGAGKIDGNYLVVSDKKHEEHRVDVFEAISELKSFWTNLRSKSKDFS
jgi:hypothetical protein